MKGCRGPNRGEEKRKVQIKLLEVGGFICASLSIIPNNTISLGTAVQPKANTVLLEATPLCVPVLVGNTSITA